jgi:energy-coupling factor transporter ATP-binding protein EcfA2
MFIRRVVLQNIKGFETADLDFCPDGEHFPGWAVITGDNGSGKTALLRAIALAILGPEQSRGLVQDLTGWVSHGEEAGSISVEIRPNHDHDKTQKGGYPIQGTFWAEVEISLDEGGAWEVRAADIFRNKKKSAVNGPWAQSTPGWSAVAYGPFRRLYGSSPDAQRLMVLPGRIPRFATLFKEDATLAECEEWVRELQYKKLEGNQEEAVALENLLALIGNEFLRHGVTVDKVDSNGIWLLDSAKRRVPLIDMSEGYRSALATLIDIFRHMVQVYGPKIIARDSSGFAYVDRPGVVLIDEVDTHLHPDWQREIGFWLQKHFPEVQFIVSTHSPLVCPAANVGRIYHLPTPGEDGVRPRPFQLSTEDFEKVIAGKPDQILVSPAFGLAQTRSPRAVRARERHARLMSKRLNGGLSETDEEELEQLSLFVREGNAEDPAA